jgi:circadian clock protein KaiC
MNRVNTFIPGLDDLLEGGLPENSCVMVKGEPGSAKTIFGLQFLYNGAVKNREAGMLIQVEEFHETLMWYAKEFGWDFASLQKKGLLAIYSFKPSDYERFHPAKIEGEMLAKLGNIMEPMKVKRVVIDAITPLQTALSSESDYRKSFFEMLLFLKKTGATSLIIAEHGKETIPEEFVCDGVIHLKNVEEEKGKKNLMILKMEATDFSEKWYSASIREGLGLTISPF